MGEQKRLVLSIPTELREKLDVLAALERASISDIICSAIRKHMASLDGVSDAEYHHGEIAASRTRADINASELSDAELDLLLGQQKRRMERWRKMCATAHPDPIKLQMCEADAQLFEKLDWEMTKRRMLYGHRERARRDRASDLGEFLSL